ncbi:MAG: 2-phospho-L-lactate transferase [Actinomycetota bacterium]|nr:2-phospho-L-lactate transferase [Actinomycetota bacterium]
MVGLSGALDQNSHLTAIVNTGDDATIYGVHVSPDVDIVTYWLAGLADRERGWGLKDDTFRVVEGLRALGRDAWFQLGDRDFATCIHRTERMGAGDKLTAITADVARALGVTATVLPMSDDSVATLIDTADGRTLEFQDYFVKERQEPEVHAIRFSGIEEASPGPDVLRAIEEADKVFLCPSNPLVSIGPILGLSGVRDALKAHPDVTAISPIIEGAALKGPADKMLAAAGIEVSAYGVAELYADFLDRFVLDVRDESHRDRINGLGIEAIVLDTIMADEERSVLLARDLL